MQNSGGKMKAQFAEIVSHYMDSHFHVVQKDADGGDSTHNTGATDACLASLGIENPFFQPAMEVNEVDGRYCRNPSPGRWYSNYNNQTRDAMINLEAAWALRKDTARARRHFGKRIKRAMFHFSDENDGYDSGLPLYRKFPDPPTPVELATIIRAGRYWALTPLLLIFDLFLILDCAIFRRINERALYDSDAKLLPCMLAALAVYPTPLVHIAKWFYARSNAIECLLAYYGEAEGRNGIAPLGELMAGTFQIKIQGISK